jgi:hypothetical protein
MLASTEPDVPVKFAITGKIISPSSMEAHAATGNLHLGKKGVAFELRERKLLHGVKTYSMKHHINVLYMSR